MNHFPLDQKMVIKKLFWPKKEENYFEIENKVVGFDYCTDVDHGTRPTYHLKSTDGLNFKQT